nr:MAG TPA: Sodium/potassium-transporting ATPase subunit alpha-1 [Caudoviricetes sp.]
MYIYWCIYSFFYCLMCLFLSWCMNVFLYV